MRYEISHVPPDGTRVKSPGLFAFDETATEIAALLADGAQSVLVSLHTSPKED